MIEAKLVGRDPATDIALLRAEGARAEAAMFIGEVVRMWVSVVSRPPCQVDFLAWEALPAARRLAMAPILNFASRSSIAAGSKTLP